MNKFSDRIGITTPPKEIQLSEMTAELRHSIWNVIATSLEGEEWTRALRFLYIRHFKLPIDNMPDNLWLARKELFEKFTEAPWYDVYNITELLLNHINVLTEHRVSSSAFEQELNTVLTWELSGFKGVNGLIVPISDNVEADNIRESLNLNDKYAGAREHISQALRLLSEKPHPDYRNSIKESISAVESIVKIQSGHLTAKSVDKPLATLVETLNLHPLLKKAFSHLYSYSSDESGIRHAILEQAEIGFPEAKYMLVSCSAFLNFLVLKDRSIGSQKHITHAL
jgi:hypothetical protein